MCVSPRYVAMPLALEIPAPVRNTIFLPPEMSSAKYTRAGSSCSISSRSGDGSTISGVDGLVIFAERRRLRVPGMAVSLSRGGSDPAA
jgi:hypothetical protein